MELASKLVKRIQDRVDGGDKDLFFARCKSDGADLAKTPFGATFTRLIARSYIGAANQYLVSGPASIGQSIADGAIRRTTTSRRAEMGWGSFLPLAPRTRPKKLPRWTKKIQCVGTTAGPRRKLRASSCTTRPWSTSFSLLLLETASRS